MDRFTLPKLEHRIAEVETMVYRRRYPVHPVRWMDGWDEEALGPGFTDGQWPEVAIPHRWGGRDIKATARVRFEVPPGWRGEPVALRVDLSQGLHVSGPDATAYLDGKPIQGVDVYHQEILLPGDLTAGEHVLALEAYSGTRPDQHWFGGVDLVSIDLEVRAYYYDAKVALDAARLLPEDSYDRVQIINALERSVRELDFHEPLGDAFRASVTRARAVLREDLYGREWPGERPEVVGVGHAHIDVAWLWTLLHTRKKTVRTFLTALRLMEQYPEYRFLQSQPQVYEFFRRDCPEEYEEIKRRVREGRWEPTGAMWLEADLNITGGESLVRQMLHGKRFLREEFGIESDILWLPDVFGYTWTLPQIMARSGVKYFMTTKISWNEFNRLPYDTFRWQGLDGTQVLAHFITTPSQSWFATYNGRLTAAEVKGTWDAYKQKRLHSSLLHAFGFGDGGGGPSADMLETARRLADMPGLPRYRIGRADEFFRDLEAVREEAPVWNGELYLEFHRGTFTSQARTKRLNRKSELALHEAEALAGMALLHGGEYPADALHQQWQTVLLNQFHDILPGSSIGEVYAESSEQYGQVVREAGAVSGRAQAHLAERVATEVDSVLLFNTLGQARSTVAQVRLPEDRPDLSLAEEDGSPVATQTLEDGSVLLSARDVPAYGWKSLRVGAPAGQPNPLRAEVGRLDSPALSVRFDEAGCITSLVDKSTGREVIAEGKRGNLLQLFEDKPLNNDAWNIDVFYEEKSWDLTDTAECRVVETGPVRAGLEFRRRFGDSTLVQKVYVYADVPRVDFETFVDWHERHALLKVAFPVTVLSPRATYEIQFGQIERATHRNTSWDYARFEVPAQRWADLSEGDYGVSLLNDCKYGYDIRDNVMRLSLLKSATSPDPEADQGEHHFTYSLYPHTGDWRCGTLAQAADLNLPLGARWEAGHGGNLPATWSLVTADQDNLVIDTVKKAEDDDSLVIRLYEAMGRRGRGTLRFGAPVVAASECNLIEDGEEPVPHNGATIDVDYLPYEVRTFKVTLG